MTARTSKEAIYDEQISPLMAQIIATCKTHKIAMLADFALGFDKDEESELKCTTALLVDEFEPCDKQLEALRILNQPTSSVMMMTVTKEDGSKEITAIAGS